MGKKNDGVVVAGPNLLESEQKPEINQEEAGQQVTMLFLQEKFRKVAEDMGQQQYALADAEKRAETLRTNLRVMSSQLDAMTQEIDAMEAAQWETKIVFDYLRSVMEDNSNG